MAPRLYRPDAPIARGADLRFAAAMSEPSKEPAPQRRWVGRVILLLFGVLLLVYFVPLAISLFTGR